MNYIGGYISDGHAYYAKTKSLFDDVNLTIDGNRVKEVTYYKIKEYTRYA